MSDIDSNNASTPSTNTDLLAGPATQLMIGGSGNTDTPINTSCDIRTPSYVLDADGRPVTSGTVLWSISTNPHMPDIKITHTNQRDCVVKGIVTQSFSLTYIATYLNLRTSKTIPVKAVAASAPKIFAVSPPHLGSFPVGTRVNLKVRTTGIPPTETSYYLVEYFNNDGVRLGTGRNFPDFEASTSATYKGLQSVNAKLVDNRTQETVSTLSFIYTIV